jgi:predicted alpha/beta-fold hydrolase
MKKQTAVEWLQKQLSNKIYTSIENYNTQSKLAFEEAKAMEKEQIADAYDYEADADMHDYSSGEQYYDQTFL